MAGSTYWCETRDGYPAAYAIARRHYSAWKNRRPKQRQFVGPGEPLVLISQWEDALFVWRKSKYRDDGQVGVCCAIFRNESAAPSSAMILDAERLAWSKWPGDRLFTHIDPARIRSTNPGYCFKLAGWTLVRDAKGKPVTTRRGQLIMEKLAD